MSNWYGFSFFWRQIRYYLIFLVALCFSLGIPGCGVSSPNSSPNSSPTASSHQATQTIANTNTSQRFDGVTINIITHDGAQKTATQRHIAGFEALTGAKVNLTAIPFKDLYKTLQENWSSSASKYDLGLVLPQWLIDFISAKYLEDLTDRKTTDSALQWDNIASLFRNFGSTYKGRTYAIPLDGDFHMIYYRADLLNKAGLKPPETWDDYLKVAQQFHNQDLNEDGELDYGSCIEKQPKAFSASILGSFFTPYLQAQGTAQGVFFDPETMKPLVNNPGFAKALEVYKKTGDYGVPDDQNLSQGKARELFLSGRCALTLDWGDVGTLAIDPAKSKVIDKVGAFITPGTNQVLDRQTNQLVTCDKFTCPYAIDGINHAPYAAYGGWVGVVAAQAAPKVKDAAYRFLSYMGQPEQSNIDVTLGETGFNPYRFSQFEKAEPWVEAGMSPTAANNYLGAIGVSLNSANMVLDLAIPQNQQYIEALDAVRADFLADKITKEEAMQQIEKRWEEITNKVGRESQRAAYRASLGLTQ